MTRRELLGSALLGAQVLLVAACGGDDEDDAEQPRAAPEAPQASVPQVAREPVTLKVAAVLDRHGNSVGDAIERWNEGGVPGAPEDVRLQRVKIGIPWSPEPLTLIERAQVTLRAFLSEQESAGIPPDLLMVNTFFDFPWGYGSGLVQPIDRYLQQDRTEPIGKFLPAALELVRYQSQTMALPVALEAGVTRYKPKQFTDAGISLPDKGWTREQFIAAAQQLTKDTDSDGNVDEWGFSAARLYSGWLPFVLQELDEDVINLDTGAVRLTDSAALRGLQFWDELGRVHGIMPHGLTVTADHFDADFTTLLSGMLFWSYIPPSNMLPGQQAPLPAGPRDVTPLAVSQAVAIPTVARDAALSYEVLRPFALHLGEHLLMPPVIAGQQHIEKPSTEYLELMLPPEDRELVFNLLDTARASPLASSLMMTIRLFERLTLPLARSEISVEQAAQHGQDWLESYLKE
ncbi:MAG: extracellular solute-binding protein [Chloroflexi bacterium]|nr:extracellular solute-binding protein [Chloroflexota bacterium]